MSLRLTISPSCNVIEILKFPRNPDLSLVPLSIGCFYERMGIWLADLLENWQLFIVFQDLLGRIDSIRGKMPPSPRYWMVSPNWTQVTKAERDKQDGHFVQTEAKRIHLEQKKAKEL